MSKKILLASGSRFALALCAGLALTGVKTASAQTVAGNTGCIIPGVSGATTASTILGASPNAAAFSPGILYETPSDSFTSTVYYCSGASYALTSSVQSAIDTLKTEIAGLTNAGGGLTAVTTDASLAGAGTAANPLRLSAASQNAITTAQTTANTAQTAAATAQSMATTAQVAATAAQSATNQLGQTTARDLGGGVTYNPATGAPFRAELCGRRRELQQCRRCARGGRRQSLDAEQRGRRHYDRRRDQIFPRQFDSGRFEGDSPRIGRDRRRRCRQPRRLRRPRRGLHRNRSP